MKKQAIVVNLIFSVALLIGTILYQVEGGTKIHYSTSGVFVLMGLVNLFYAIRCGARNLKFYVSMAVGLCLCMLGDILLGKNFFAGAATFASGHICYFLGYCFLKKLQKIDFAIGGVIFAAAGSFLMFYPGLTFWGTYIRWVCLAYAFIISMMAGKAISNFVREKSKLCLLLAVGSCLFFFSDLMLALNWFANIGKIAGKLCMITYFPANWCLALGLMVAVFARAETEK